MKEIVMSFIILIILITGLSGCMLPPTEPPEAKFSVDVDSGNAPLTVNFTDESHIPVSDGRNLKTWSWDFKDGATSNERNLTHTFVNPGEYEVILTVIDDEGYSDSFEKLITVTSSGFPKSVIMNVTSDSYVSAYEPDKIHGLEPILKVDRNCYILLTFKNFTQFDQIIDAKLKLYPITNITEEVEITVYTCANHTWKDTELTWRNTPIFDSGAINRTIIEGPQQYFLWNITSGINKYLIDDAITLALVVTTFQEVTFYSSNSNSSNIPKLEIKYQL